MDATTQKKDSLNVADFMTRNVFQIEMDTTVWEMSQIFQEHNFHHLVVMEEEALVGIISDRDVLRSVSPFIQTFSEQRRDRDTLNRKAHQIMTRHPVTIVESESLFTAGQTMLNRRVSCLPVVDAHGKLCGIITSKDVIQAFVHQHNP